MNMTLDEVRAAMREETDPVRKWELSRQARELRGHKDLFGPRNAAVQRPLTEPSRWEEFLEGKTVDQLQLLMSSATDEHLRWAAGLKLRELRGHANLFSQRPGE
jgi:hypothetical protein